MIKIKPTRDYARLLANAEQGGNMQPLIIPDTIMIVKSADSLFSRQATNFGSHPSGTSCSITHEVPAGECWELSYLSFISNQNTTDLKVIVKVPRDATMVLIANPISVLASLSANTEHIASALGSSRIILHPGDQINVTATLASTGTAYSYLTYKRHPDGFSI